MISLDSKTLSALQAIVFMTIVLLNLLAIYYKFKDRKAETHFRQLELKRSQLEYARAAGLHGQG